MNMNTAEKMPALQVEGQRYSWVELTGLVCSKWNWEELSCAPENPHFNARK